MADLHQTAVLPPPVGRMRASRTFTLPSCSTESTESQKISLSESLVNTKPSDTPESAGAQRAFCIYEGKKQNGFFISEKLIFLLEFVLRYIPLVMVLAVRSMTSDRLNS